MAFKKKITATPGVFIDPGDAPMMPGEHWRAGLTRISHTQ